MARHDAIEPRAVFDRPDFPETAPLTLKTCRHGDVARFTPKREAPLDLPAFLTGLDALAILRVPISCVKGLLRAPGRTASERNRPCRGTALTLLLESC